MITQLASAKFIALYGYLGLALYIHFRGKARHRFRRQLFNHSTFMAPYNSLMYGFSAVPASPVLAIDAFTELAPLKDNWQVLRAEAQRLYDGGHICSAQNYNDLAFNSFFRRGWKRFYLQWYADMMPSARDQCPRSVALVEAIPSVNAAMFAMLPPGGKLGQHRDPFAGSLRYHLGLATPNSDACHIEIDGTPYAWRDGEAVLFDATYIHSAVNNTDTPRIILFCDVTRPLKTRAVRALNRFAIDHVVKISAARNVDSEKIGVLNRLSGGIHALRTHLQRIKKANRRLYYLGKYVIFAVLVYGVFLRSFW